MMWLVYDRPNNRYLKDTDYEGYPTEWVSYKSAARWYGHKEIAGVLETLKKFGFEVEQVGYTKNGWKKK